MEIIAKTEKGCLIQAAKTEVEEIIKAVTGYVPEDLVIGQKIPAIDYASTITKIQSLGKNYVYEQMLSRIDAFIGVVSDLRSTIQNSSLIEV